MSVFIELQWSCFRCSYEKCLLRYNPGCQRLLKFIQQITNSAKINRIPNSSYKPVSF